MYCWTCTTIAHEAIHDLPYRPQKGRFEPCAKARNTGLPALQKSVSKLDVVPHRRLLRKRVIAQRMNTALVSQGSRVAKRYCIIVLNGDTFEQCRSATPESPLTIRTPPSRWRLCSPPVDRKRTRLNSSHANISY